MRACLERVELRESEVRAWAFLDPELALRGARERDAARIVERREGRPPLPLDGVPVAVKDIFDTADMPTECGSPIHAGRRPVRDAACVALLRSAGAIVVGKSVTTEFAFLHPGATRNPCDPARTPGGSSSGSAAAVADAMVPVALGTQTAGSIVRPASFCGVFGFKPTFGAVAREGVHPLAERLDTVGWLARDVEDLGLMTKVLTDVSPAASRMFDADRSPRVGLFRSPQWQHAELATRGAIEGVAERLARAGARVEDASFSPPLDGLVDAQKTIMAVGAARALGAECERHPDRLSPELTLLLDEGRAVSPEDHRAALELAERGREELGALFQTHDVLLTPSAPGEAPRGLEATGDPIFCRTWTLLGAPAVSVPGLRGPEGMPLGIQLVARPAADAALLAAARWVAELPADERALR